MNRAELPEVYLCDFEKNDKCPKDLCQTRCFYTLNKKYSKDGKKYFYDFDQDEFRTVESG